MTTYTATYSPDDNKLRLYPSSRLDAETYARVKAHGFKWAPKQDLFFAPMWTPSREDFLLELAGEIGDEDTSLTDRAEQRAERFEDYSEKRAQDSEDAHAAVQAITANIPLAQPILVGHHSERHARRDQKRIQAGMDKAVKMWRTAEYWEQRAKAALRHAAYKELPSVRARRIKTIEADRRKVERTKGEAQAWLKLWAEIADDTKWKAKDDGTKPTLQQRAIYLANRLHLRVAKDETGNRDWSVWDVLQPDGERYKDCPSWTVEQVQAAIAAHYPPVIANCDRWLEHYDHRLSYERTMLGEQGGIASDRTAPEIGGAVMCWAAPRGGWAYIKKVNKITVTVWDNWGNGGGNFRRNIPFDKLRQVMTAAQVQEARDNSTLRETACKCGFHLAAAEATAPEAAE